MVIQAVEQQKADASEKHARTVLSQQTRNLILPDARMKTTRIVGSVLDESQLYNSVGSAERGKTLSLAELVAAVRKIMVPSVETRAVVTSTVEIDPREAKADELESRVRERMNRNDERVALMERFTDRNHHATVTEGRQVGLEELRSGKIFYLAPNQKFIWVGNKIAVGVVDQPGITFDLETWKSDRQRENTSDAIFPVRDNRNVF